jgi:hypothetical protein
MMRKLLLAASVLVLPLAILLLLQWPLRDVVQAGSPMANDFGQIVFALYMAVAVSAATHDGVHLTAGHAPDEPDHTPARWRTWVVVLCTAPWACFLLWASAPSVWQSVQQTERFGETLTAGYFVIRMALWLLAGLVLLEGLAAALRPARAAR